MSAAPQKRPATALVPRSGDGPADPLATALLARMFAKVYPRELETFTSLSPAEAIEHMWAGWKVVGTCAYKERSSPSGTYVAAVMHHPDGAWANTLIATSYREQATAKVGTGANRFTSPYSAEHEWSSWSGTRRHDWAAESIIQATIASPGSLSDLLDHLVDYFAGVSDAYESRHFYKWATVQAVFNVDASVGDAAAAHMMVGLGGFDNLRERLDEVKDLIEPGMFL